MTRDTTTPQTITFEQPVNEQFRICLRLEYLFKQLNHHRGIVTTHKPNAKLAVIALVRILDVIDRPDLKSKLTQTLTQYAGSLAQLQRFSEVDADKLQQLLQRFDHLIDFLHKMQGKLGNRLRANEFLNQIRLQLACPWGVCDYNAPAFSLWLCKEHTSQEQDLIDWMVELSPLDDITQLILQLTRESATAQTVLAKEGVYQQALNANLPCQMVQVILPVTAEAYPEISVSKHKVIIRLLAPDFQQGGRAKQVMQDIPFYLKCCRM